MTKYREFLFVSFFSESQRTGLVTLKVKKKHCDYYKKYILLNFNFSFLSLQNNFLLINVARNEGKKFRQKRKKGKKG